MKRGVYRMRPALKRVLWGGRALQQRYGKDARPDELLGESWEVSALPGMESVDVASGLGLATLWSQQRLHLAGPQAPAEFPLLVKLLHCAQKLSVQVHPDDATAQRELGQPRGKREAWLVLEAEPGAHLWHGLAPGKTPADLKAAVAQGSPAVEACLQRCAVQPGDVWLVEPGTVHAPGSGLVMLEVQQPSDVTLRLWDWDRRDAQGAARPLQIEAAISAMKPIGSSQPLSRVDAAAAGQMLVDSPSFRMEHWRIDGAREILLQRMTVLHVLEGPLHLHAMGDQMTLQRGETCVLPCGATIARLEGSPARCAAITAPH